MHQIMNQTSNEILLRQIEQFLKKSGMSATSFGDQVLRDRHLVRRMRRGGGVTLRTADRVDAFIAEWRPARKSRKKKLSEACELA